MKADIFGRLSASLLAVLVAAPCLGGVEPYYSLGVGLDQLAKGHAEPGRKLPFTKDGAARLQYKERWLALKPNVVATYKQPAGSKTITRIILHIPEGTRRTALLRALMSSMGLPANRAVIASGRVNATWISGGVTCRLIGAPGVRELVIQPAVYNGGAVGLATGVIVQDLIANATGSGHKDLVNLIGIPFENHDIYMKSLYLVVVDPRRRVGFDRPYALGFGGIVNSEVLARDFNGDGKNELLITAPTGGNGGLNQYALVSLRGGVLRRLADSKSLSGGPPFIVRFRDGLKARVTCRQPKGAWTLDLRPYRKIYISEGVYNAAGKLLTPTTGYVDGVGLMKVRGSGPRPFLVATQRIWGTYHANIIGQATVRWRWSRGKLRIVGIRVSGLGR